MSKSEAAPVVEDARVARAAEGSLSIGMFVPGWPPESVPNGIATYVGAIVPPLRAMQCRMSILAGQVQRPPDAGVALYDAGQRWRRRSSLQRWVDRALYRAGAVGAMQARRARSVRELSRRMAAEQRLDLIEMEESWGVARAVRRATGIPVCVRLHGPWFLNGAALGVREDRAFQRRVRAEGRAIAEADGVSAPSRDVLERVRGYYHLPLAHAEVIPLPAVPVPPAERWRLDGCDRGRILFVGRFDRHKGGDLAVEALRRVLARRPDAHLSFVGPDRGLIAEDGRPWSLEAFVRDRLRGAASQLQWLGEQPSSAIPALRRRALVTVVCSRYENVPYAAIEALTLGCPVVAARTGGIPELVEDGVTGLLHAAGDADDLAGRILELLDDPGRASALGHRAGVECERRLAPAVVAAQLLAFYGRVLARVRHSR